VRGTEHLTDVPTRRTCFLAHPCPSGFPGLGPGGAKRVLIAIPPPAATLQAARGLVGLAAADSQRSSVSMIDRGLSTSDSVPGRPERWEELTVSIF
jgi:hypothetical protein